MIYMIENKLICILLLLALAFSSDLNDTLKCVRDYINSFQSSMDPHVFRVFSKAFPNTLETTIQHYNLKKG